MTMKQGHPNGRQIDGLSLTEDRFERLKIECLIVQFD